MICGLIKILHVCLAPTTFPIVLEVLTCCFTLYMAVLIEDQRKTIDCMDITINNEREFIKRWFCNMAMRSWRDQVRNNGIPRNKSSKW